mmetsp:Transcript_8504/g.14314  ORF Transcript_8504/g.14314 Transcript_8504/m.14314 type:complete len:242 (-) Transcript_8504:104-829(-)
MPQRYQNKTKYRHNFKGFTKQMKKILDAPLDHLCQRCHDQIAWKIDYEKYKPLSSVRKCAKCTEPRITKAYRQICDGCAVAGKKEGVLLCTKCNQNVLLLKNNQDQAHYAIPRKQSKEEEKKQEQHLDDLRKALDNLKLRQRKTIERKMENGEISFNNKKKAFMYCDDPEKEFEFDKEDQDAEDYDDEDEGEDQDDEEGRDSQEQEAGSKDGDAKESVKEEETKLEGSSKVEGSEKEEEKV